VRLVEFLHSVHGSLIAKCEKIIKTPDFKTCLPWFACNHRTSYIERMELLAHLRRQFAYDAWANREVFAAMVRTGADGRSLQLLAHILSAERLWLERLQQQPQSFPVWPELRLEDCRVQADELPQLWRDYLATRNSENLTTLVSYKNSKGESWTNNVIDILTHVVMHSAYHRGQIATHVRACGKTPAYTDFIHAVRQHLSE
jgi:uncharacterized damage-inducible protein DinB